MHIGMPRGGHGAAACAVHGAGRVRPVPGDRTFLKKFLLSI
jgi:hypothetical protein